MTNGLTDRQLWPAHLVKTLNYCPDADNIGEYILTSTVPCYIQAVEIVGGVLGRSRLRKFSAHFKLNYLFYLKIRTDIFAHTWVDSFEKSSHHLLTP